MRNVEANRILVTDVSYFSPPEKYQKAFQRGTIFPKEALQMDLRFWNDPETGLPHIYEHGVTEEEVRQVLARGGDEVRGSDHSRIRIGQTEAGRYLQVVYVPDPGGDSAFVVTAYDLKPNAKRAYRRRQRRRRK
jgi:uncharacterized protein DUF4258